MWGVDIVAASGGAGAAADSRRGGPLQPPSDHSRPRCGRAEAAQERPGAGDRRGRARGADVAVPGRGRASGTIGIVDFDVVEESNLQRQIIHGVADVGRSKAQSARDSIAAINPLVEVRLHEFRLDSGNAVDLFGRYDLIVDGTDNFATRYLVNDAAVLAEKAVRVGVDLPVRGPGLGVLGGRPRRPGPQLPRPLPGATAPGHGAVVRRGRRAGHHLRLHRLGDGHRGDQAHHRNRRTAAGPADDLRRACDELPHHHDPQGPAPHPGSPS